MKPELLRELGFWDATLLTIGTIIGTGIFLTPGGVAAAVGASASPFVWIAGGLITLAGALTYAEMGAMFPKAGGLYHFLREAWGPLWGFLFGWTCLICIMSGGIAAIAVGFAEYFVSFFPLLPVKAVALMGILFLTLVNHVGLKEGARLQDLFTIAKLGAIGALVYLGFSKSSLTGTPIVLHTSSLSGFGVALIATLWTYDGWYGVTFSAGEMKNPSRDLPRGLIVGVAIVVLCYFALSAVYLRALSPTDLAGSTRVAEDAALLLGGKLASRWMALAVVISSFGCLAATILYSSRVYQPMAADGVFFKSVATIHPRFHTPVTALWLQTMVACLLVISGSYNQLFTFVTFGGVLFHVFTGLALFRLRFTHAHVERPYKTWGYPWLPALFVLAMTWLTVNTLIEAPRESMIGVALILAGTPAYFWWKRKGTIPNEEVLKVR